MSEHGWVYNQLFTNWKKFEITYITALILLQLIVYAIEPDSPIGMISGVAGVLCLVLAMKGRRICFFFGIIQCLAMTYIAWIRLVRDGYCLRNFATDRLVYVGKRSGDEIF